MTRWWGTMLINRRGHVHGIAGRLSRLENRQARAQGPYIGIEDAASGVIRADGGRTYASADEFFAAGRRGDKLPLLIALDREPSPHNRPEVAADGR